MNSYNELVTHAGHTLEVAIYGGDANAAIECVDCSEVLLDYENTEGEL
jgi:hypothetical protein